MQFFHHIVFMSLFRAEVYQAKQNRWTGRIVLTRPFSFTFLTICAVLLALALVLFTIFSSYTDKTSVEGQLLPRLGVARVYPPEAGIITAVHVAEGEIYFYKDIAFIQPITPFNHCFNSPNIPHAFTPKNVHKKLRKICS